MSSKEHFCEKICPSQKALKLIGGKWKLPILYALSISENYSARYSELMEKVQNISNTMLATSLKELEKENLIHRIQYNEMPLRVEYSLTQKAKQLKPILEQLVEWSRRN